MNTSFLPGISVSIALLAFGANLFAQPTSGDTAKLLESARKKHDVPAIGVVVVHDGKIVERVVVGARKAGDKTPATVNDVFHIGSCTKSMTATLAGILIEDGKIRWDSTVAEVLPELKDKMNEQYQTVTLEQLLQNRGGLPTNPPPKAWEQAWAEKGTVSRQRLELITAALGQKPEAPVGKKMIYSNQGFTLAAMMLERVGGKPWEALSKEKLFQPLGMKSVGFGVPGIKGKVTQPWGHTRENGKNVPVQSDNPPAIGPAGRVYCTLEDLGRYAQLHVGSTGAPKLLKPETLARLHAPPAGEEYACGWVVVDRPWADGKAIMHNGSNNMWYAVMWLAPKKGFAVIVTTNLGGAEAEQAADEVAAGMINKWL